MKSERLPAWLGGLENRLGYKFGDKSLLVRALTHASASADDNYEQLEFLGDSVIQLAVTLWLYQKGGTAGKMTAERQLLVSHAPLKQAAAELGLPDCMIKEGESAGEKALSSVYESVCGAICADGGYEAASKFISRTLLQAHVSAPRNVKGDLQEYLQQRHESLPEYHTRRTGGSADKPEFESEVTVLGRSFIGRGGSKAEAEKRAAAAALNALKQ